MPQAASGLNCQASGQAAILLVPQKVSHQILMKGAAREHMMFVEGGDPLDVPVESLAVVTAFDTEHKEGEPPPCDFCLGEKGGRGNLP